MERFIQVRRVNGSGVADYPPGATFGPRHLHDYELVWILEGSAEYRLGDQTYMAPEGSIILCRPGTIDAFAWDTRRRTRHAYVHFETDPPRRNFCSENWVVIRHPTEGDILIPLFQHLLTWIESGSENLSRQTLSLMLNIYITDKRAIRELPPQLQPDPVERAIAYLYASLEHNAEQPITLEDLASAACVTPEHLCRLFKKAMNRTPMECVRMARLDRSVVMLTRSNFSIGQIARMCGFASQFHFTRLFRNVFGATPTEIRSRIRAGKLPPLSRLLRSRHYSPSR